MSHLNKVNKILIFDVISATDDEHNRVLERRTAFGSNVATFKKFSIEIEILVGLCVAFAFHKLFGDLCDRKILGRKYFL